MPGWEPLALLAFLIAGVALIGGLAATRGPVMSAIPLAPQLARVAPKGGRLLGLRGWIDMLRALTKAGVLGGIAILAIVASVEACGGLDCLAEQVRLRALPTLGTMVAALVVLGLADATVQRWLYRRDLRMSLVELRDERKRA